MERKEDVCLNTKPYVCNTYVKLGIGGNNSGNLRVGNRTYLVRDVTNFVWNICIGAMFKSDKNFGLDLGYRYMNLGNAKTNDWKNLLCKGSKQIIRGYQILGSLTYYF